MRIQKILSMLLAVIMLFSALSLLASCNAGSVVTDGGDQIEVGAILKTARAFSAASALMQYLNENSKDVVHAYYEKGLKYKYNDDKNARAMMDIVRETTDAPFGMQIGVLCQSLYTGTGTLSGMKFLKDHKTWSSVYNSEKDAYVDCLNKMIEKFEKLD